MPHISDKKINSLLDLIYETAIESSSDSWFQVCKAISDTFSSGPGGLSFYISDKNQFEMVASIFDSESLKKYNHYYKVSPFRKNIEKMESCSLLKVKENTARTHLKRIFSKTETHRQNELIKLILTGPANLRKMSAKSI